MEPDSISDLLSAIVALWQNRIPKSTHMTIHFSTEDLSIARIKLRGNGQSLTIEVPLRQ